MSVEDQLTAEILGKLVGHADVEHHLEIFAEQIADEIRDLTPEFGDHPPKRDEPGIGEPGDLKASIKVLKATTPGRRRIQSDDPKVYWAEMGAKHFPEVAMFARVAALHGGTGPDFAEAIHESQHHLRGEREKLEKLLAVGAPAAAITAQRLQVKRATIARSAAFKAYRPRRRGR